MTDSIIGCVLGTAVGDALGLPYEGLSRGRARRMLGTPSRHRFFFTRGMISDDTEHTCMVAQSLIESGNDVNEFARQFAKRIRWWMLAFPAGVGKATALSGMRLWLGAKLPYDPIDPEHDGTDASPQRDATRSTKGSCGVFSAGNGPAMRAAIFGAAFDDLELMLRFVRVSTRLTHSDPKAEYGAIVIALAAYESRTATKIDANQWLRNVVETLGNDAEELCTLLTHAVQSVASGESTSQFAESMNLANGITGYTYHTVPAAIHAWLSNPENFRIAVTTMIECGGDADTTAAIVGGIVGCRVGCEGIPKEWIDGISDWPRSVRWMTNLAETLSSAQSEREQSSLCSVENSHRIAPRVNPLAILVRNLAFLLIVLFHGFRRLAPPY
ncbi:ADP-ribosylglycohydrolase [Rhodopirellula rubra]|uniref:ADP-ribosylglycohydrolase n=1 Tax=Aporhodopirellula rubra TaxID=980271 RepID=A0A7W5DXJ6_9BACT|nr:ADP-ribosylglycohydrolase family protein [Aporhodopirellula rubra]MBB3206371.1 ADP-ribosylglycohydrolase [Aporhodopirellula rubra]